MHNLFFAEIFAGLAQPDKISKCPAS